MIKAIFIILLLIPIQACEVGEYYVFNNSGEHAGHTKIYEGDLLTVSMSHFNGKSSIILIKSKKEIEISVTKANIKIEFNGNIIFPEALKEQIKIITLKPNDKHMILYTYKVGSKPTNITEIVEFVATVGNAEINVTKQFNLSTKSYGWFEATKGI